MEKKLKIANLKKIMTSHPSKDGGNGNMINIKKS
jgi:hypothetical protein